MALIRMGALIVIEVHTRMGGGGTSWMKGIINRNSFKWGVPIGRRKCTLNHYDKFMLFCSSNFPLPKYEVTLTSMLTGIKTNTVPLSSLSCPSSPLLGRLGEFYKKGIQF